MSKAEHLAAIKNEEKRIHDMELKVQSGTAKPESELDYEVIVAKNPNSSLHWIQFIAHYIEVNIYFFLKTT